MLIDIIWDHVKAAIVAAWNDSLEEGRGTFATLEDTWQVDHKAGTGSLPGASYGGVIRDLCSDDVVVSRRWEILTLLARC